MKKKRTAAQQRVHEATFAAAFAEDAFRTLAHGGFGMEAWEALQRMSGERAMYIADLAAEQYAHWLPDGGAYK